MHSIVQITFSICELYVSLANAPCRLLARRYRKLKVYERAGPCFKEAIELLTSLLGPDHAETLDATADSMLNLACMRLDQVGIICKAWCLGQLSLRLFVCDCGNTLFCGAKMDGRKNEQQQRTNVSARPIAVHMCFSYT